MNIADSFSLCFSENMLNMSYGGFKKRCPLFKELSLFFIIFSSIFLPLNDVFTLIKICLICQALKTWARNYNASLKLSKT